MTRHPARQWLALFLTAASMPALADGNVVDKVYHPYVQPLETEVEWRAILQQDDDRDALDDAYLHRLGIGRALSDRWFAELYIIGAGDEDSSLQVEGWEAEAKWQLTEQGQYSADWGLLFELEKERSHDAWEHATTLIAASEWRRWVGTANLALIYEWGDAINDELETELRAQWRYRWMPAIEPAIEFYAAETNRGIGPVLRGTQRLAVMNQLTWEVGVIAGITDESPDATLRMLLEYEFY